MIGFFDALTLARTKLRTKRILLITTITVAALLFGVIIAGIVVVTGASNSAESYLKSSLGNRYLVQVDPVVPMDVTGFIGRNTVPDDTTKAKLLALQDAYLSQQKALAAQYGVRFDASTIAQIITPSPFGIKTSNGQLQQVINTDSPVWSIYVKQLKTAWLKTANNTLSDLKQAAGTYGATEYYQNSAAQLNYLNAQYIEGGKEDIAKYGQSPAYDSSNPAASAIQSSAYNFTDQSLIQRYLLPKNAKRQNSTAIPAVVTVQEAVKLFGDKLGIKKEPSDAAGQITWMKNFQNQINGQTYQVCYRSQGELNLIQQIMQQTVDAGTATKDHPYTPPALTYNLPDSTCGDITVKEDTRTAAEKKADTNTEAYQKANGTYQSLSHQLLTFQIVGVMPIGRYVSSNYTDIPSFVNGLLSPNFLSIAFIPNQLYNQLPSGAQHKDVLQTYVNSNDRAFADAGIADTVIAFSSPEQAQAFINADTCYQGATDSCGKPWTSNLYGSNYLLINSFSHFIASIARIALPIALVLAIVIIWITMARVITDSRRETAVFRALGAKRGDIIGVYLFYSLMVALWIVLIALLIGAVGATVIEVLYGSQVTNYAKVAYGVFDQLQPFTFIGIDVSLLGLVIAAILIISLVAVLPPLLRNIRRNPIRDMRDE